MRNLIKTIKNNDSTTNVGLAVVTLVVLPLLITIVTNIDVNRLF